MTRRVYDNVYTDKLVQFSPYPGGGIQGLTNYGSIVHQLERIGVDRNPSPSHWHVPGDENYFALPVLSLYRLHPLMSGWFQDRYGRNNNIRDGRYPYPYGEEAYFEGSEDVAKKVLKSNGFDFEQAWSEFSPYIDKWGVFSLSHWLIDLGWSRPSSFLRGKSTVEQVFLIRGILSEGFGINPSEGEYLSRRNQLNTLLDSWVLHWLADRVLNSAELTARALQATERCLEVRVCVVCGTEYQRAQYGANFFRDVKRDLPCCLGCPLLKPGIKEIRSLVPQLIEACGFIPHSGSYFDDPRFCSRLADEQFLIVADLYRRMGGIDYAAKKGGGWLKLLLEVGVFGERGRITPRGIVCLSDDGHVCHSIGEMEIDNWMHQQGISHEKEPHYPRHPILNPKGGKRADWRVGDTYIEYFGMAGDKTYDKRAASKRELAREAGLDLIEIYPVQLNRLGRLLGRLRPGNS